MFFCAVSNSAQLKLTQLSEKNLEFIQLNNTLLPCSVPAFYSFFNATFPSLLFISCLLISLPSLHFLPQAVELEVEQYFSLIPHSTMLTILSLKSLLQESVLDTSEPSAFLPTSPHSLS